MGGAPFGRFLIVGGAIALFAAVAAADAPDVANTTGTAVVNGDGTITVSVSGTWTSDSHNSDCNVDRYAAGWAKDWNDANDPGNHVTTLDSDSIDVGSTLAVNGNAVDNDVHFYPGPTPP